MRFKDLKEGVKYKVTYVVDNIYMTGLELDNIEDKVRNNTHTISDGILCVAKGSPTAISMVEAMHLKFQKQVGFVDFKTAFNAMADGKICSFYNIIFTLESGILSECRHGRMRPAYMSRRMLDDVKWVILDD